MILIPNEAEYAINALNEKGYAAYLVGGFVRNSLMGIKTTDCDITTSATPDEVIKVFQNFKVIETGIKHGTVTVIISGIPLEITTFRIDENYIDNRHPEKVRFTKELKDDLARRDFTVNALAYNKVVGLVDEFGGLNDIKNRVIKAVGNPDERFNEDALRIMRAIRFAAVLGFEIEPNTEKAIFKNKNLLLNVSSERIFLELVKLITGQNAHDVICRYHEVLEVILPEIKGMAGFDQKAPHHIYDVLKHTAVALENTEPQKHLRLAVLLHDCGKPQCFVTDENGIGHFKGHPELSAEKAEQALRRLKADNETILNVVRLIAHHDDAIPPTEAGVKRALNALTVTGFFDLIKLKRADNLAKGDLAKFRLNEAERLYEIGKKVIDENQCFSLRQLDIKGDDLIALGIPRGKKLGETLNTLLDAVIDGKVENQNKKLIDYTKNHIA